jgi:hypothetical protein
MTEQFILQYIPIRMRQLGYNKWHIRYRDILMGPNGIRTLSTYNELFYVIDAPTIAVYSDYGTYAPLTDHSLNMDENKYEHRGEITLFNDNLIYQRIKLIQVIIVN